MDECAELITDSEYMRGCTCIKSLVEGACSFQTDDLPACFCNNAKSSFKNGPEVTDTIAVWTVKKYIAGPFKDPPFKNFRVNSLMAIEQATKVRPVLNVSLPKDYSFNDNVEEIALEKIKMSSARKFSFAIVKCGKHATMSKFDMVDAYKNIPAPLNDLRLQGSSGFQCFS